MLLLVAVFLLLPVAAQAATPPAEAPGSTEAFVLHGSHHYKIVVQLKNRRMLAVGVVKEKVSGTNHVTGSEPGTTTYEVASPQPQGSDDIDARIGGLGRIDARFVPGRTERVKGCEGPKLFAQAGHFVGTIDFRGEGGYTSAHASRVWGVAVKVPAQTCSGPRPQPNSTSKPRSRSTAARLAPFAAGATKVSSEEDEPVVAKLLINRRRDQVQVTALGSSSADRKSRLSAVGSYIVSAERHLGPVKEWGFAFNLSFKGTLGLRLGKPLEPATDLVYSPPAPFSGSATLRPVPGKEPTWTGDLALQLPGFGRIALTGSEIHAALCRGSQCLLPDTGHQPTS
jgi:hypothetical protein